MVPMSHSTAFGSALTTPRRGFGAAIPLLERPAGGDADRFAFVATQPPGAQFCVDEQSVAVQPATAESAQESAAQEPDDAEALAKELAAAHHKVENLTTALATSRIIGTAVGVLVERLKLLPDAAFRVLAEVSQRTNRKVRDVASELVETGVLAHRESHPQRRGA
ncbi:hypothetical protein BJY21_001272 [Kineosphaera limosa]|uniref:ANTAR domain-containing protein n=1 Tax=Kineosphaera limosa NBRC 100340 TaxID=1184609 RepID=K6VHQ6_9MICO|nr:ANTAR domain-containing protein [Kineosphaera limosa]NYE00088.1 hypothetical protein [Kineosphaera limosa]GAB95738.1 hypothetical protein KILIM_026_00090 [Kineosphaera limosa NBRC 100340]